MGSLHDKSPSRLNQKTLGVTNRIWLIISLFLALLFFTRFVLPTETQHPRHRLLHSDLKPKNYLNISDGDTVPFSFCPALGPTDELAAKYDSIALAKTRMHVGSGARMQRVVSRALAGHPVTISVVGGSGEFVILFCAVACFREGAHLATLHFARTGLMFLCPSPFGLHEPVSFASALYIGALLFPEMDIKDCKYLLVSSEVDLMLCTSPR